MPSVLSAPSVSSVFKQLLRLALLPLVACLLAACSGSKEKTADAGASSSADSAAPARDIEAEAKAYYAAHPDFFVFKTPADLPADLKWEDGSDLPELGSPERKRGGVLQGRIQDFPLTLRPIGPDANSSFRGFILDDNAVTFAMLHPDLPGPHRYYAGVAEAWAIDAPSKTIYVRIDTAARWSDGPAITTDDVLFMFFFFQSSYINDPWSNNWYGIGKNYTRVTRYDERTFAITVAQARPDFPALVLSLAPTPRHFYRELGDDYVTRYNWRFEPTTGPWVVTDAELKRTATTRNHITLTRLENWWANDKRQFRYRHNPAAMRLRVIRETPKSWEAFLLGELDEFRINLAEYNYERLPDDHPLVRRGLIEKHTFYNDVPRPPFGLWMNSARPPLDNLDVRLGVQFAANWQLVIDQYFRGDYTRLASLNRGFGDMSNPNLHPRPFDVARAREHFAKAGYTQTGEDGILRKPDGARLSIGLSTGYEQLAPVLTILQQEARKAGLELRVEVLDSSNFWKKTQEKNQEIAFLAYNFSIALYPRYWEYVHSSNAYDQPYLADGRTPNPTRKPKPQTNNLLSIADPELDELVTRYDKSESLDDMRVMAYRMEEMIHEHASFSPGYSMPFFRTATWRWIKFPPAYAARFSDLAFQLGLHWIDEDAKAETLAALRDESKSFPPVVKIHDRWKAKE